VSAVSFYFLPELLLAYLFVIAIFWPNKEMGRNQDGLGGYTCNTLLDRPCAWI
jgi:hypothetical protein